MLYIYGSIYHQYTPNVSIYTITMDPSWVMDVLPGYYERIQKILGYVAPGRIGIVIR